MSDLWVHYSHHMVVYGTGLVSHVHVIQCRRTPHAAIAADLFYQIYFIIPRTGRRLNGVIARTPKTTGSDAIILTSTGV